MTLQARDPTLRKTVPCQRKMNGMNKKTRIIAAQHAVKRAATKAAQKVEYIRQLDEAIEELKAARDHLVLVLADEDD